MHKIIVAGVAGSGLTEEQRRALAGCRCLVASRRHLAALAEPPAETVPITPLPQALTAITKHLAQGDVGVLASGDPLFFGIGRTLLENFAPEGLEFLPALSTVQLACARFRLPWDDARIISLHGRQQGVGDLLAAAKTIIFTDHRSRPNVIAARLQAYLELLGAEQVLAASRVLVAENPAGPGELLTQGTIREIATRAFGPLNLMILLRGDARKKSAEDSTGIFGLRESEIRHSRGLITKDEIRAITLHKLRLPASGVFWDIGAGSGSVSIEAARLATGLEIFALERREQELLNLKGNIVTHGAFTVRPVAGEAPAALDALPDPDRIFIGGSGGALAAIVAAALPRLRPGGRVVINGVTPATRNNGPGLLREHGCRVEIAEIEIRRHLAAASAGTDGTIKLNPISIITGNK